MTTEAEIRNQILEIATEKFFRLGFSKVTTDEIAAEVGISKKTLYKFFTSKDKLLEAAIAKDLQTTVAELNRCTGNENMHFVAKLRYLLRFVGEQYSKFSSCFEQDLEKSAPHIWSKIKDFRENTLLPNLAELFRSGKRQGVLRNDLDTRFTLLFYFAVIREIINCQTLSQLPLSAGDAFDMIIRIMFKGMLSDAARVKNVEEPVLTYD